MNVQHRLLVATCIILSLGALWYPFRLQRAAPAAATGVTPVPTDTEPLRVPTTNAVQVGDVIYMNLSGTDDAAQPSLTVAAEDQQDWTPFVTPKRNKDGVWEAVLPVQAIGPYLRLGLKYEWALGDGTKLSGSIMYQDPMARQWDWQVTVTDHFVIHHVSPLPGETRWDELLAEVESWTGQNAEHRIGVWVLPEKAAFLKTYGSHGDLEPAGYWRAGVQRIVTWDGALAERPNSLLVHELVHALHADGSAVPPWFLEGVAELMQARYSLRFARPETDNYWRRENLRALQERVRREPIHLLSTPIAYGDPPLDPYTAGFALWLFIKDRRGDEAVQQYFRDGVPVGVVSSLEEIFGTSFGQIMAEWNEYVASGEIFTNLESP